MAEALKHLLNEAVVRACGHHLQAAWRAFPRRVFEHQALRGLEDLAFKARAQHIRHALTATLPTQRFDRAAAIIEASLAPPTPMVDEEPQAASSNELGNCGWIVWSLADFVAVHGQAHQARALQCLHALTQRFTAEFAIRPFIVAQQDAVFRTLQSWVDDPSPHVRRLVSEGTRPRLPWGLRLQSLVRDPTPSLPLLRALQDDPCAYVRRSVANHLNDIAKDHAQVVVHWVDEQLPQATPARRQLLRHASRSLIKAGHPGMLTRWGVGQALDGRATLSAHPRRVVIGGCIELAVMVEASPLAQGPQALEVDVAVLFVRARADRQPTTGVQTRRKVFKGWRVADLAPGAVLSWSKTLPMRPLSTRALYPGRHVVELIVNGQAVASTHVELRAAKQRPSAHPPAST